MMSNDTISDVKGTLSPRCSIVLYVVTMTLCQMRNTTQLVNGSHIRRKQDRMLSSSGNTGAVAHY